MNMTTVQDYINAIEAFAPFSLAESWDNAGLLIGSGGDVVTRALVALDATMPVLDEALRLGADLIVTHHPVIFSPLKNIATNSVVYRLIREGIAVVSAHTNLDIAEGGVNSVLAARLALEQVEGLEKIDGSPFCKVAVTVPVPDSDKVYHAMVEAGAGTQGDYSHCGFFVRGEGRFKPGDKANPHIGNAGVLEHVDEVKLEMLVSPSDLDSVLAAMKTAHPYEEVAFDVFHNYGLEQNAYLGRVGKLSREMSPEDFAACVKERLGLSGLKYVSGGRPVERVAVCGGSGADFLHKAAAMGCQALVTGESKHHLLLDAARLGVTLIDAGHYGTERVALGPLRDQLAERLPAVPITVAATDGDNINYI